MQITNLIMALGVALTMQSVPPKATEPPLRLSWYWPDLGGTNCHAANWNTETNKCSALLYGKQWQEWEDIGAACPSRYKIGTKLYIHRLDQTVVCVDRGGGIVSLPDGSAFIDLLQRRLIWVKDWRDNIIKDRWCPSGCYWSRVTVIKDSSLP